VALLAATWVLPAVLALAPPGLPRLEEVRVDGRVLGFAFAATTLSGIACGLVPVWQSTRVDAAQVLRSGRALVGAAHRPQKLLVVGETALALVLLFGAGLLLRSFDRLLREEPGFRAAGVATAWVSLPAARYPRPEDASRFFEELRRALAGSPGVLSAAASSNPPLSGWRNDNHVVIEGYVPREEGDRPGPEFRIVSADHFRTLGIPIVRGREFVEDDDAAHPPVAVVSRSLADTYWAGGDAVGGRLKLVGDDTPWITIVGIAGDVKQTSLADPVWPTLYLPHLQSRSSSMMVVVRTAQDPRAALATITGKVRDLDRQQAVSEARTMEDVVSESLSAQRFNLRLLGVFAGLAVALAAVGTFGVMRYMVGQRTAEIGLRMALGAGQGDVLRQVLREGIALAVTGLVLGVLASAALALAGTGFSSLLHGVTVADPLTMAAVVMILLGIAAAACWSPARRATRVDPAVALRGD
jgi:putative ABC transport system permease protein